MVNGSQSLSLQQLEEQKLMSFADNLASQTQCTMGLWETWGGLKLAKRSNLEMRTVSTA